MGDDYNLDVDIVFNQKLLNSWPLGHRLSPWEANLALFIYFIKSQLIRIVNMNIFNALSNYKSYRVKSDLKKLEFSVS